MMGLSAERAREIADTVDAYDQQLADAQEGKRETFETLRNELANAGMDKQAVKNVIAAFKRAIRVRQMRRSAPEKLSAEEEREALALEYLDLIDAARAPRATYAREAA
ncbi:hypothetical protein [Enterovirga sp. CN4-39]|uniref:hypothetical protein n=1 Tax=Enterovirga sp. CN4-39 TaxID=3400910 RepID=UPI003BFB0008